MTVRGAQMPGLLIRTFTCPVWRTIKKEEITVVTNQVLIVVVVFPDCYFPGATFLICLSLPFFLSFSLPPKDLLPLFFAK